MTPKPLFTPDNTAAPVVSNSRPAPLSFTTVPDIQNEATPHAKPPKPITPAALFGDQGFNTTDIDPVVRTTAKEIGEFTDIELARITHILKHELSKPLGTDAAVFEHIEKMQETTSRSNDKLTEALSSTVISELNNSLKAILNIITTNDNHLPLVQNALMNMVRTIRNAGSFEEDKPLSDAERKQQLEKLISTLKDVDLPKGRKVLKQMEDAIYFANNDRKQLQLYHIAGKIKHAQLTADNQNVVVTANNATASIDNAHHLKIFGRRVDSIATHVQAISISIMQAQTIQHTLDNFLLDVNTTVLVSVPSYIQQLGFMATVREFKDANVMQEFEKLRSSAIKDLKQVVK